MDKISRYFCLDNNMEEFEGGDFVKYNDYSDLCDDYDLQCQFRDMYRQETIDLKIRIKELEEQVVNEYDRGFNDGDQGQYQPLYIKES